MKKLLALLLVLITVLSLAACAEKETVVNNDPEQNEEKTTPISEAKSWLEGKMENDELFSFAYNEVPFDEHISQWEKNIEEGTDENGNATYVLSYEKDGVKAWAEILLRNDMPCIDWVCYFENTAASDSLPISDIQALDAEYEVTDAIVNYAYGGNSDGHDFEPLSQDMAQTNELVIESFGGRSSQGYMPFYDVEGDNCGVVVAIGWTGQWTATLTQNENTLSMVAGMSRTDISLRANESTTPPLMITVSLLPSFRLYLTAGAA